MLTSPSSSSCSLEELSRNLEELAGLVHNVVFFFFISFVEEEEEDESSSSLLLLCLGLGTDGGAVIRLRGCVE